MKKSVMMGKRGESGRETRSVVWRGNSSKRLSFHCHIHMKAFFSFFSRGSVSDSDDQGGKKLLFLLFFRVNNKKLLKGDSERVSSARKCFCCCLHLLLLKDAKCGEREREREWCQKFLTNSLLRCKTLQQSRSDKQNEPYVVCTLDCSTLLGAWPLHYPFFYQQYIYFGREQRFL